jgi:hypothetical protein
MPTATDQQMQTYTSDRVRVFAEAARALLIAARDHKAAIDDVYARANGGALWSDNRTDGPPHLLAAGSGANPDDVLNFNAAVSALIAIIDGTGNDAANAAALRGAWPVLMRACVRAPGL